MAILVSSTDFKGVIALPQDKYTVDLINSTIEEREKEALIYLLGIELADLFIADLSNGVPVTAKYLTIYNPLAVQLYNHTFISKGLKDAVLRYIYFHYVCQQKYQNTITGVVQKEGSNSSSGKIDTLWLSKNYNVAVDSFRTIQYYILQNNSDYTEYNGTDFGYQMNF